MTDEPVKLHCEGCRCQGQPRYVVEVRLVAAERDLEDKIAATLDRLRSRGRV